MLSKRLSVLFVITSLVVLIGAPPVVAAQSGCSVTHIVRRGETLSAIAHRYGVTAWQIAQTTGITNPNRIYVGQRLTIPTCGPTGRTHVVLRGENLYGIALRHGVDAWAIARANRILNLNRIYVGQRLVIPGVPQPAPHPGPQPAPQPRPGPMPPEGNYLGPWNGEYFGNATLGGSPYLTRSDPQINLNWAYGPPAGGMPTNYFSVRWTGTFHFGEGSYRFYAKIDDGVRVFLDDQQIINGWRAGGLRAYSAERTLSAGDHTIRVEYYERIGVARAYFWVTTVSGPAPSPAPDGCPQPPTTGWYGEYFNALAPGGTPYATRYEPEIAFDWGPHSPIDGLWLDGFSVRWTTRTELKTDHYRFCARADDGVRIWVGGTLVVDEWHPDSGTTYCGVHWAETGTYDVKVEYYDQGGNALIHVWWEPH